MSVTSAKIRAREKAKGKNAYTAIDSAGNLHYAFDKLSLGSILTKANNKYNDSQSAKAYNQSVAMSDRNNAFNADQVQKQMDFQNNMSSTAHQREVKDLVAAGLNPVLSANGGASSPSGGAATADTSTAALKMQYALQQMQVGAQLEMNKQNIASAQTMAKWSNALQKELGYASLSSNQQIAKWSNALQKELGYAGLANNQAVANISAGASMYSANQSSAASRYSTDNSGGVPEMIFKDLFSNSGKKSLTAAENIAKLLNQLTGKSKSKKSRLSTSKSRHR